MELFRPIVFETCSAPSQSDGSRIECENWNRLAGSIDKGINLQLY